MKIERPVTPAHMETILIKIIIIDLVLTFLVLGIIFNFLAIYYKLAPFPQVLLLIPAISVLCAVIAVARFYDYISTVVRVSGALTKIYREFDGGEAVTRVEIKQPFLIFRHFVNKYAQPSEAKIYRFVMDGKSAKYKVHAGCSIEKGRFLMFVRVIDWHGLKHERSVEGPIAKIQPMMSPLIRDIRREVLEARGIQIERAREQVEYYIPAIEKPKPVVERKPEIITPKVSLKKVVEEIEGEKKKPKPVEEIDKLLSEIKQMSVTKETITEQKKAIKETLQKPKGVTKKDKEALQDVLFQLEEIEKMLKER
ncbi:MAG: hypothetical protein J7K68_05830 [Candidatus Diapherotrites archaeon]|nr:hypothetical protein [Candidatus Diapherotrites archaeon]